MFNVGVLSKSASSRSFDASADGYARGEAISMIYVKRLDDALRDGNPVRAIIRATASNCDGKTPGLTKPSSDAQYALSSFKSPTLAKFYFYIIVLQTSRGNYIGYRL